MEAPGILALPPERRMDHDGLRTEHLRRELSAAQLDPRVGRPHALRDHQTGGMYGEDRHAVLFGQPSQGVRILADRVRPHHDLDAVVTELIRGLERERRRLGEHRGGRQSDQRLR